MDRGLLFVVFVFIHSPLLVIVAYLMFNAQYSTLNSQGQQYAKIEH
jgi:hypothetical protein